ncbi:MAG: hypothetical protein IJX43_04790 [Alphaproteobacteria bacterium]|nr:hypothetical protein [Alphaproteobacteria bacterium]
MLAMTKEYMKQWIPACAGMTVLKFCKLQVPILCVARCDGARSRRSVSEDGWFLKKEVKE